MSDPVADVAALKATVKAQSIEIRDLKRALADATRDNALAVSALGAKLDALTTSMQPVLLSSTRLIELLNEAEQQKGMGKLARLLVGGGAFGFIAAALTGVVQYFSKGAP